MKKFISKVVSLSIAVGLCGIFSACTPNPDSGETGNETGNETEQVTISNVNELADYIRCYYIQEGTQESHYMLDSNYKLSKTYTQYSGNILIPEYPESIMADALPDSWTYINKDGDFYSKIINTAYGAQNIPADYYFLEEQSHEIYYKADVSTGYAVITVDNKKFDTYPEFEDEERTYEARNFWKFATADELDSAKNSAASSVNSLLGFETVNDLFKVDISDWTDPIPHIDEEDFDKLNIVQNGNIVSFEIVYSDEYISSTARGTLNVSELDFTFTYDETRHEENDGIIESQYNFELVAIADNYQIDFDTSGQFIESSDYFV